MKIIYLFVLTCNVLNIMLSDAAAQDRWPNLPAEGPVARRDSQYGVNRRVAIGRPEDAQVIGYFQIEATFDCKFAIPSSGNITAPGDLPNKPTFYFGIRGPVRIQRNGQTVTENREVDAGLEWDSRANHRGWRAFISVNGVQTNYNINGVRWRGLAQQYFLRLRIDDNGIPWMRVQGGGANFSFPWSSDNQPHGSGEAVFPGTARELLGLKRVIADTRPEPSSGNERDNYRLDGTRINCMTSNNRIYYYWNGVLRDGENNELLTLASRYSGIDGENTGYDTPFDGNDSYDSPLSNGRPSARSRRRVDFPLLTGAAPIRGFPNIIDTGRTETRNDLTTQGANVSRYTTETVRINLEVERRAQGRLVIRRLGTNP